MKKYYIKMLPELDLSLEKCSRFYKENDAETISHKNIKLVTGCYTFSSLMFLLCLAVTIYDCIRGDKSILDLLAYCLLFFGIFILIYNMRYSSIKKRIQANKEAIIQDLPEFIDRIILLLNAGMVIESVLVKIAHDNKARGKAENQRILYSILQGIIEKNKESNSSLVGELSTHAIKSGVREFIRFSSIIESNYNKGSSLVEKLESEGMLLWMSRKKLAEEKARLAGTKLSFPLMLLLMSLIVITSAPMLLSI